MKTNQFIKANEEDYFPIQATLMDNSFRGPIKPASFKGESTIYVPISPSNGGEHMSTHSLSPLAFWLGIASTVLTIVGAAILTTWTVSNSIDSKVNQARQEITGITYTSKVEVTNRLDRLEDKVESGLKETNAGINDLKVLLSASKKEQ